MILTTSRFERMRGDKRGSKGLHEEKKVGDWTEGIVGQGRDVLLKERGGRRLGGCEGGPAAMAGGRR